MSTQTRTTIIIAFIVAIVLSCSLGYVIGHSGSGTSTATPGSNTSTIAQAATATPKATNTPTATPKSKNWTTIHHFTGTGNTQTDTFDIHNGDRVVSSCTTSSDANLFIAYLYAQGTSPGHGIPYAQLVDTVNQPCNQQTYTIQEGDATVYLHVECDSISWTVDIQRNQ